MPLVQPGLHCRTVQQFCAAKPEEEKVLAIKQECTLLITNPKLTFRQWAILCTRRHFPLSLFHGM